jgi:xanthine dehydrogenase accessory factor
MNGSNWFVIQQLNLWLAQGIQPWLATVVETYGSSPRPEGSMMIYHPDKGVIGSLSGGCIEQELIAQLANKNSNEGTNPIISTRASLRRTSGYFIRKN